MALPLQWEPRPEASDRYGAKSHIEESARGTLPRLPGTETKDYTVIHVARFLQSFLSALVGEGHCGRVRTVPAVYSACRSLACAVAYEPPSLGWDMGMPTERRRPVHLCGAARTLSEAHALQARQRVADNNTGVFSCKAGQCAPASVSAACNTSGNYEAAVPSIRPLGDCTATPTFTRPPRGDARDVPRMLSQRRRHRYLLPHTP